LSLLDTIRQNHTYHAGALTYHFMLSIAPLTLVLAKLLSLLPFFEIDRVEVFVDRFFPQYTAKVVHEIVQLQKRGIQSSFLALFISYLFSVGFLKTMSRAFSYVSDGTFGERREVFYWLIMPLLMLASVLVLTVSFFLSVYLKVILPRPLSAISDTLYVLPGATILFLVYLSLLKRRVSLWGVFSSALVVSLSLFFIQALFTWYLAQVFKGSLIYGSLSTVVAFLLWVNLIFLSLLMGARLIYRLESG